MTAGLLKPLSSRADLAGVPIQLIFTDRSSRSGRLVGRSSGVSRGVMKLVRILIFCDVGCDDFFVASAAETSGNRLDAGIVGVAILLWQIERTWSPSLSGCSAPGGLPLVKRN